MSREIKIKDFSAQVMKELDDYSQDIADRCEEAVDRVADDLVDELKRTSPVRKKGKSQGYAKGWTKRVVNKRLYKETIVYNKKFPNLTHLLEFGHASRNGGTVYGIPHIKPAEDKMIKEYEKAIEEITKR